MKIKEYEIEKEVREIIERNGSFQELVISLETRGKDVPERSILMFIIWKFVVPTCDIEYGCGWVSVKPLDSGGVPFENVKNMIKSCSEVWKIVPVYNFINAVQNCMVFFEVGNRSVNEFVSDRMSLLLEMVEHVCPGSVKSMMFSGNGNRNISLFSKISEIVKLDQIYSGYLSYNMDLGTAFISTKHAVEMSGCASLMNKLVRTYGIDPWNETPPFPTLLGCRSRKDFEFLIDTERKNV